MPIATPSAPRSCGRPAQSAQQRRADTSFGAPCVRAAPGTAQATDPDPRHSPPRRLSKSRSRRSGKILSELSICQSSAREAAARAVFFFAALRNTSPDAPPLSNASLIWADLTRSPRPQAMSGICAQQPVRVTAWMITIHSSRCSAAASSYARFGRSLPFPAMPEGRCRNGRRMPSACSRRSLRQKPPDSEHDDKCNIAPAASA